MALHQDRGNPYRLHQEVRLSELPAAQQLCLALALVAGTVAIVIAGLTTVGTDARGVVFAKAKSAPA